MYLVGLVIDTGSVWTHLFEPLSWHTMLQSMLHLIDCLGFIIIKYWSAESPMVVLFYYFHFSVIGNFPGNNYGIRSRVIVFEFLF